MARIRLMVNGVEHGVEAEPSDPLLWVLRDGLGLTGAKYGCGEGQCGACTVLVDGQAVRSCVSPVTTIGARQVTTIEGLAGNGRLHPVQQAFVELDAYQCGYCTPGMIMGAVALIGSGRRLSSDDVARLMNGHVCRCGAYPRIVEAVQRAAAAAGSTPSSEGRR